ncbi:MAG TPA: pyridoxine 5'-phosphate synthase [Tepidisphaeraceae bacterium]|jgi:pyridoxine 5-phosphate synthase
MTKLSVNVNKIATLRNTRALGIPSVVRMARIALEAGAHGITVHPRPDERHIRPGDVDDIARLLRDFPEAEYNIEGNPFHGLIDHCLRVAPHQATLVPDTEAAATSDHGWPFTRLLADHDRLRDAIDDLHDCGCRVSLFVDPDPLVIAAAQSLGVDRVELYTEPYARRFDAGDAVTAIADYAVAARVAVASGLGVNAGHDLTLDNLPVFLSDVAGVDEVSIGHALVADALEMGMAEAVRRYAAICAAPRTGA